MKQTTSLAVLALINNSSASHIASLSQQEYIDGSHPVTVYEANGADSNRDHPTPQVKGPELSNEQRSPGLSEGNSHYWGTEAMARQQGWSNEINPWSLHLNNSLKANEALPKAESAYTSLADSRTRRPYPSETLLPVPNEKPWNY